MRIHPANACLCLALVLPILGAGCNMPKPAAVENTTSTGAAVAKTATLELFTSETCPHCQNVKREIAANGWDKILPLNLKPVEDSANQRLALERARACRLPLDRLQVPLLWNGQRCLSGDGPILDYLTRLSKYYETSTSTLP